MTDAPDLSELVTNEMVRAFWIKHFGKQATDDDLLRTGPDLVRAIGMTIAPAIYRAGWEAGREAADDTAQSCESLNGKVGDAIRALTPPGETP